MELLHSIIGGSSAIDLPRLYFDDLDAAAAFLAGYGFEVGRLGDRDGLEQLRLGAPEGARGSRQTVTTGSDSGHPGMASLLRWIGERLGRFLSRPLHLDSPSAPTDPAALASTLRPGDVLLVEGHSTFSVAIRYLTQSTWSHAALFVGDILGRPRGVPIRACSWRPTWSRACARCRSPSSAGTTSASADRSG